MLIAGEKGMSLLERFLARVIPEPNSGCWLWLGYAHGRIQIRPYMKHNGIQDLAYRIAYRLFKGEIPDGLNVCHTCDTPLCVNPDHLYAGTQVDNTQDSVRRRRHGPLTHYDKFVDIAKKMGARNKGRSKLSPEAISDVKARHSQGVMIKTLAAEYNVDRGTIRRLVA